MALSNEKKKEILLQSFNVLKKDIYNSSSDLHTLICKTADFDLDMALEMWKFVLENYSRFDEPYNETCCVTQLIVRDIADKIGIDKVSKFVFENLSVRNKLYHESACVDDKVMAHLIDTNQLDKANVLFELIHSNVNFLSANDEDSFGKYLHILFNLYCQNITKDKMNFISSWVEKVPTEEGRAKLYVILLDYM